MVGCKDQRSELRVRNSDGKRGDQRAGLTVKMSDEDGVEVLGLEGEELKLTESPFRTIDHCFPTIATA